MARPRKRFEYAPVKLSAGEMINSLRKTFEGLRMDGRVASRCGLHYGGEYLWGKDVGEELAAYRWAVNYAIHSLVFGLSRATANPPEGFRLEGRGSRGHSDRHWELSGMPKPDPSGLLGLSNDPCAPWRDETVNARTRRGRPLAIEGRIIAHECANFFWLITGRPPRVQIIPGKKPEHPGEKPERSRPCGVWYDLLTAVFKALAISDSVQKHARQAQIDFARERKTEEERLRRSLKIIKCIYGFLIAAAQP
jgi:hypothetical protein